MSVARRRALARLGPPHKPAGPNRASIFSTIGRRTPLPRGLREAVAHVVGAGDASELAGRKIAFAALGALGGVVLTHGAAVYAAAPLFAAGGWRFPDLRLARGSRDRDGEIRAALPDALDLLAVCALAGLSLDHALRTVAPDVGGPLGDAMREMLRALDAGMPREPAYRILADGAPIPEVRSLVRALIRAERYGSSVATTLVSQAREIRSRHRAVVEEASRKAPIKMLFPLVVCFLPAFVILTVAPVVLTALQSFRTR